MTSQQRALGIIMNELRTLAAVIDALKHVADEMALGTLTPDYKLLWSIVYYIDEFPDALQAFSSQVSTYAGVHYKHMAQEEAEVLTKAGEVPTAQDRDEIAAAFAPNKDPLRDQGATPGATSSDWFRQFYRRIVTLVPEPWGVGARR